MLARLTHRRAILAAPALIAALAFASPAATAYAHAPCGKNKMSHTNCGMHKGAGQGKKEGHKK